jgi:hydroxypyruvate isomerase
MDRRHFLATTAAAAAVTTATAAPIVGPRRAAVPPPAPFRLKYAPHFGMFAHHAPDRLDQLQFAFDQGFRAWEDNGMAGRPVEEQQRLAAKMQQLGIEMGVFVAHAEFGAPTFASGKAEHRERVLADMKAAVEVGKRLQAKWCTVVPGTIDPRQEPGFQTANVVDLLRRCADVCAESGLVMVLEALNFRDHPNLFLTKIAQGFQICRAVAHPCCKLLDDLYHQQVQEGNLIPNLDRAWDEIAYFQIGDNPGRNEPGTGEIHYGNVFAHLHGKGYAGLLGMEHGNSRGDREGELAVIEAYRRADAP